MVDRDGLDELHALFPGYFYSHPSKPPKRAWFTWAIFNGDAQETLKELLPYLKVKHKQAAVALRGDWYLRSKGKLSDERQALRKQLAAEMKELNKRGC